jgi:hypothetical protein
MSQQHQRHNDDDSDNDFQMVNGRPVLKDGARFHVPLKMLDSVQRQIHQHFTRGLLHDGFGGPVGFRPGFVILDDTALRDAREQARARYIEEITGAYNASSAPDRQNDSVALPNDRETWIEMQRNFWRQL